MLHLYVTMSRCNEVSSVGQIELVEVFCDESFPLAISSIVGDLALQVHSKPLLSDLIQTVLATESDDRIQSKQRVVLEGGLGSVASAVARGRANHKVLIRSVAQVNDAVPEPRRIYQHVSWMENGGVSLEFVHPGRYLAALLAHHGVSMCGEAIHVDARFEIRGLAGWDEPPLLLSHHLTKAVIT